MLRDATGMLAPILVMALVTGHGLLPLVVTNGEADWELERPMAIVILGHFEMSTALNLLVLLALALHFKRSKRVSRDVAATVSHGAFFKRYRAKQLLK